MRLIGYPDEMRASMEARFDVRPRAERPAITEVYDAFVIPGLDALYDKKGRRIELSKRVFVPTDMDSTRGTRVSIEDSYGKLCPPVIKLPERFTRIADTYLYGGLSWGHYGHFLTDAMSRLWAVPEVAADLPILFLDRAGPDFGGQPFSRTVVDALGIGPRLTHFTKPTRIRRVLVPTPAIQHASRIYHAFSEPHEAVARAVLAGAPSAAGTPVYLSRSGLNPALRQSLQERELESRLAAIGFEIVHPERLSLAEQIAMFNQSPLIAGMAGSAFHTLLFALAESPVLCVMLSWGGINSRYPMIDAIKGRSSVYVNSSDILSTRADRRILEMELDVDRSFAAIHSVLAGL